MKLSEGEGGIVELTGLWSMTALVHDHETCDMLFEILSTHILAATATAESKGQGAAETALGRFDAFITSFEDFNDDSNALYHHRISLNNDVATLAPEMVTKADCEGWKDEWMKRLEEEAHCEGWCNIQKYVQSWMGFN
jgi:hypothetical protein